MNPKALLDQLGIDPKKSLGQNFLLDPNILDKIVGAADLPPGATVLEIGAGTGALTARLAARAERVIAVEIDQRMQPVLTRLAHEAGNVEVVYADILTLDPASLTGAGVPFCVVANVPYYITSAILRHLLEAAHRPWRLVLLVQLEVAQRVMAQPGDMSLLAVSVQFYARPSLAGRVSASVFYPRPEVDSAILRLDCHPTPPHPVPDEAQFFRLVRAGFSQKRKQLKNTLAGGLGIGQAAALALLDSAAIDPMRRAETLSIAEWAALARAYAASSG
jgi:16S rRNA (adenine1518-N6/adenine1519-N6)-dimethyltransferase